MKSTEFERAVRESPISVILGNRILTLSLCLLFCLSTGVCQAGVNENVNADAAQATHYINPEPIFVAWLNKPWVGDDAPFKEARRVVENAEEGGTLASVIEKYHNDAKADPTNLAAQATYLYAVWLNRWANDVSYTEEQQQDMDDFNESLWRRPHPNTYNYTRIASLCWNSWASDDNLIPFLNRLIREDKNDAVAQYLYPGLLAASGKPILLRQAIAEANEFVAGHPNLNVAHIIAGYTYYMQWLADKDPTASKNAIDSYRTYLAEAPSNGYHRLLANGYISFLTKR